MTPSEYETLVASLIRELTSGDAALTGTQVKGGRDCRLAGMSGYDHQIDVALETDSELVIVECKCWGKKVGVAQLLVLAGRKQDLMQKRPGVRAWVAMVSTRRPTKGACQLAEHFGISIDTVATPHEFVVRLHNRLSAGVTDGAKCSDSAVSVAHSSSAEPA